MNDDNFVATQWVVGRRLSGARWSFVSRFGGRTKLLSRARVWHNDGHGWAAALDARELPGDGVYRADSVRGSNEVVLRAD